MITTRQKLVGKIRGYSKFAMTLSHLAKLFNIHFKTNETRYIRLFFQLMAATDVFIDNVDSGLEDNEKRRKLIEECVRTGNWTNAPQAISLRLVLLANCEIPVCYQLVYDIMRQILEQGSIMRTTLDQEEFINARKKEGGLAADLIFRNMLLHYKSTRLEQFANYVHSFGMLGNLIDTLLDMHIDYKEFGMRIKPTLSFKWRVLREIWKLGKENRDVLLKPRILLFLTGIFLEGTKNSVARNFGLA